MTMQIYNLKNDRDIARHCSLDFSDKIYLKFNKRHSVENYIHIITGKTPERGAIDILMRIARYRPATEREREMHKNRVSRVTFPKGCNQSLMSLAGAGNCA